MRLHFHPVADNPIRMACAPGWKVIGELLGRLNELGIKVGGGKVIPAPWEPYYDQCPCYRDARAYAWARRRLQDPTDFAAALAFFPDHDQAGSTRGETNLLMLRAEGEASPITGKLMLSEALERWDLQECPWLEQVLRSAAALGMVTSLVNLRQVVRRALDRLKHGVPIEDEVLAPSEMESVSDRSQAFDKELLQMEGWTQNPGTIYVQVDGRIHSLANEILLLDLQKVALLRGRRLVRSVDWNNVTLVYRLEDAIIFDVAGEPPFVVSGFRRSESALKTAQECYRAATERMLQALATQVTRTVT